MVALKDLMGTLGSQNMDCRTDGSDFDMRVRAGYLFNAGIAGIDEADAILIVGANPRHEATIINARIRKAQFERHVKVGFIGPDIDLGHTVENLKRSGGS